MWRMDCRGATAVRRLSLLQGCPLRLCISYLLGDWLFDLAGSYIAETEWHFGDGFLTLRQEHADADAPADFYDDAVVAKRARGHYGGEAARHAQVERPGRFIDETFEVMDGHVF